MRDDGPAVHLRDVTLREGLDTPGVKFDDEAGLEIARALHASGVAEAEIVAPSRVLEELRFARLVREAGVGLRRSGLIYATAPHCADEVVACARDLDRFDLLLPLSEKRPPAGRRAKIEALCAALARAGDGGAADFGAGLPHATQVDASLVAEVAAEAARAGARRITIYDTNGSSDPFAARSLVEHLRATLPAAVPIFFHGHNDLGLATANSLAAVLGGASGLDVTVNGLGDRAGNANLEQVVMLLRTRGFATGVEPQHLRELSRTVEQRSGVAVSKLAPVVGDFVFTHRSPGHFTALEEFEAFAPDVVRARRTTA